MEGVLHPAGRVGIRFLSVDPIADDTVQGRLQLIPVGRRRAGLAEALMRGAAGFSPTLRRTERTVCRLTFATEFRVRVRRLSAVRRSPQRCSGETGRVSAAADADMTAMLAGTSAWSVAGFGAASGAVSGATAGTAADRVANAGLPLHGPSAPPEPAAAWGGVKGWPAAWRSAAKARAGNAAGAGFEAGTTLQTTSAQARGQRRTSSPTSAPVRCLVPCPDCSYPQKIPVATPLLRRGAH